MTKEHHTKAIESLGSLIEDWSNTHDIQVVVVAVPSDDEAEELSGYEPIMLTTMSAMVSAITLRRAQFGFICGITSGETDLLNVLRTTSLTADILSSATLVKTKALLVQQELDRIANVKRTPIPGTNLTLIEDGDEPSDAGVSTEDDQQE